LWIGKFFRGSLDINNRLHSITTYTGEFPNGEHYLYFLKESVDDLLEEKPRVGLGDLGGKTTF
jgi:hypothetical protein